MKSISTKEASFPHVGERGSAGSTAGTLAIATGLLALLSAIVINPWVGAYYRTPIINYQDVLVLYLKWSVGLGVFMTLGGVVLRRFGSELAAKLALLVVSVAVVLLVDRLLLVALGLPYWIPDPVIHYRHRPNTVRSWWMGNPTTNQREQFRHKALVINEHGFHDHSFPLDKPDNQFRGLFLGDSVTMGHGVTRDEVFANRLEGLLGNHGKGFSSYQFINAGVQGYSISQELHTFKDALRFKPDFVAVGFCLNDITEPYWIDKRLGGTGWYYQVSQVSSSFLGYLLNETGFGRLVQRERERQFKSEQTQERYAEFDVVKMAAAPVDDGRFEAGWKLALYDLENIYNLARQNEIPVVLLIFPFTFQLFNDDYDQPQQIVKDHARRHEVDHIDFVAEFETILRGDMERFFANTSRPLPPESDQNEFLGLQSNRYFLDEDHFTPAGHRVVAERLVEYLRDRKLVAIDGASLAFAQEERRADYSRMTLSIPGDFDSITKMARSLEKFGQFTLLENTYLQAVEGATDEKAKARYCFLLGNVFYRKKQHERAAALYRQGIRFDPDFAAQYVGLGGVLRRLEQPQEAARSYRKAAELHSTDPWLFHEIGRALVDLGDFPTARRSFEKAIELDANSGAQFNLGLVCLMQGQTEDADSAYAIGVARIGAVAARRIGAVNDLKNLVARDIQTAEARRILNRYWKE